MAAGQKGGGVLIAIESFAVELRDGSTAMIRKGITRARQGSEVTAGAFARYWEPIDLHVDYDVEQATAAPGEARGAKPADSKPAV